MATPNRKQRRADARKKTAVKKVATKTAQKPMTATQSLEEHSRESVDSLFRNPGEKMQNAPTQKNEEHVLSDDLQKVLASFQSNRSYAEDQLGTLIRELYKENFELRQAIVGESDPIAEAAKVIGVDPKTLAAHASIGSQTETPDGLWPVSSESTGAVEVTPPGSEMDIRFSSPQPKTVNFGTTPAPSYDLTADEFDELVRSFERELTEAISNKSAVCSVSDLEWFEERFEDTMQRYCSPNHYNGGRGFLRINSDGRILTINGDPDDPVGYYFVYYFEHLPGQRLYAGKGNVSPPSHIKLTSQLRTFVNSLVTCARTNAQV